MSSIKHVPYDQYLREVTEQLSRNGVFLTSRKEKDNTMTMGWGGITYYWRRPIFIVPVRTTRYTWHAIDDTGESLSASPEGPAEKRAGLLRQQVREGL